MRKITTVDMVKTMEEMQQAYAIRREVFMGEGGEPEEEQFDGNDFCAAHLLVFWDNKPVATMRLRVVSGNDGGMIIWERMAILRYARERNLWIFRALMKSARHYTDLMGIANVIGIVENPKLVRFWKIYGGVETGEQPIDFRGHMYRPICLKLNREAPAATPTLREAILPVPEVFAEIRRTA